jgi:hypothetical protein
MLQRILITCAMLCISEFCFAAFGLAGELEDQIRAKYGNADGVVDAAGMRRLSAALSAPKGQVNRTVTKAAVVGQPPPAPTKPAMPKDFPTLSDAFAGPNCIPDQKSLFVRGDPLDDFHYLVEYPTTADAKGASISYTDNRVTNSQTATINGRVSYLMLGLQCQQSEGTSPNSPYVGAIGVAPFISSNGTWMEPPGKTPSNSAIKGGMDFQLGYFTLGNTNQFPFIQRQYFYVSPYYQTDYANLARISGVTLAWEPVAPQLWLDSGPVTPWFSFFWQFRGEAEFVSVDNHGLTNLVDHHYDWIGETTRANLGLFPVVFANQWPEWLGGRIALIGTAQYFYDAYSGIAERNYSATIQYKLGQCKKDTTKSSDLPCAIQGASSVSFEYDWGTDKDTLVTAKQYLLKLNYAY